jgi:hypothetical protein
MIDKFKYSALLNARSETFADIILGLFNVVTLYKSKLRKLHAGYSALQLNLSVAFIFTILA